MAWIPQLWTVGLLTKPRWGDPRLWTGPISCGKGCIGLGISESLSLRVPSPASTGLAFRSLEGWREERLPSFGSCSMADGPTL